MGFLKQVIDQALGSRWGSTIVLGLATAAVGGGVVAHDSPEGKAFGVAGGLVLLIAAPIVGAKVVGRFFGGKKDEPKE